MKNMENNVLAAKNILSKGLEIHSSVSYTVSLNEVTAKPKASNCEVGSCVAIKQKT